MESKSLTKELNKEYLTIDTIRFPLVVMVVMLHSFIEELTFNGSTKMFCVEDYPIYCNIGYLISKIIARSAVPTFFIISGYLLYKSIGGNLTMEKYKAKLRSRARTILVPYVLWNTAIILIMLAAQTVFPQYLSGDNKNVADYTILDLTKAFWCLDPEQAPINFPLWYLRDLMVNIIISPLIYLAIKKTKFALLIILFALHILGIDTGIAGLSIGSMMYFSAGMYMAINGISIIKVFQKIKMPAFLTYAVLILIAMINNNVKMISDNENAILGVMYRMIGAICIINVATMITDKTRESLSRLSKYTFFIFAYHAWVLRFAQKLTAKTIGTDSDIVMTATYIIIPIIVIATGVICQNTIKRISPKTEAILTGNRG